jgi:radical SAM protein with 4Fe4S-binding SPASM domain
VLEFLNALRSRTKCRVRGSSVVRSGWRLSQAVDYLRRLPVDTIKAQAVRGRDGEPYALSESEKATYLQDLEAIGAQVIAELEAGKVPKDDRFSARVLQLLTGIRRDRFCAAGDTTFGVTPEGEILPCVLITTKDSHLGRAGDSPSLWRQAGRQWRASRQPRPECRTCPALALCGGGCPAILPICGADECDLVRKNCEVATSIYEHFRSRPETLLTLAGIT